MRKIFTILFLSFISLNFAQVKWMTIEEALEAQKTQPKKILIEIKAFSPSNTRPSDIADAIRITLTRHARFAGFIPRQ